ncbi:MAG: flagellar M-ring protein FliF [Thermodesulfobacterium geofontis]|uniref:Flagellar M-ring protein n=1 Tax=Thermodesulfobacterium geofontis TaxID=1295609 RepID=A0A2N7QF31_9BACT|nr:MAG: flagellar M-ring protein FliF [Thermodesulfobacterium geofontis]PMP97354.1 MAG: flagellar M-ring protein FliF [Thermodesulfobacterium geofontis]
MDLRKVPYQLIDFWKKLNRRQKMLFIGGSIGIALLLVLSIWLYNQANWGLLYRGLDEQTTGQIVQYLKEQKIPYKVEMDGSIYVPKDKVPEVRMEIASKGLIGGAGPGFELFDKEKMGLTEFQEKVTYQRALEGELARTIMGIRGVKSARVHLALPKETVFIEEEKPPKASVLIELKPGYQLSPSQIKGIVNLVSGAVPKLEPKNVTVVDANTGKSLYTPLEEEEIPVTKFAYKEKVERQLKEKIEEILSGALGYGKAIAQVWVDLSFDKENIMEETYDPEGIAVVSEETEEEQKTSKNPEEGGEAGVKGTLLQKMEATSPQIQGETYSKKRSLKNYEVSKKVRNLEISPGSIKKISVAVLVDKNALGENATAKLSWIEELVKGAIGYNPDRGDEVKVQTEEFVKVPMPKPGVMDYLSQFYKPLLLIGALVLIFLFVIRPLIKALTPKPIPVEVPPTRPGIPTPPPEEEELGPLPQEIALGIIKSQPERAAMLIKKWLLEETLEERKKALSEAGY